MGQTLEEADIAKTNIIPVKKTEIVNIMSLGWPADNVEGITVVDKNTIVVVSDNDYQVDSTNDPTGNGAVVFDRNRFSIFGIISNLRFSKPLL